MQSRSSSKGPRPNRAPGAVESVVRALSCWGFGPPPDPRLVPLFGPRHRVPPSQRASAVGNARPYRRRLAGSLAAFVAVALRGLQSQGFAARFDAPGLVAHLGTRSSRRSQTVRARRAHGQRLTRPRPSGDGSARWACPVHRSGVILRDANRSLGQLVHCSYQAHRAQAELVRASVASTGKPALQAVAGVNVGLREISGTPRRGGFAPRLHFGPALPRWSGFGSVGLVRPEPRTRPTPPSPAHAGTHARRSAVARILLIRLPRARISLRPRLTPSPLTPGRVQSV